MKRKTALLLISAAGLLGTLAPRPATASAGTEGASFLELPTGARPAALGNAYTALANDAYGVTSNPAGLARLPYTELNGMHLIYVEDTAYEYASFAHPFGETRGIGAAIQYFRPGDVEGRNESGEPIGDISGSYAAFNLGYGQRVGPVALGITGKAIRASIDDVSASAFAMDAGAQWQPKSELTLGAVLQNVGSKLKFISEGDSLPLLARLGGAYRLWEKLTFTGEGVYRKSGPLSFHSGVEYMSAEGFSIRSGYTTERTKEMSALAGLSVGVGMNLWGHELGYTWIPLGDFGHSHYLSFSLRFGQEVRRERDDFSFFDEGSDDTFLLRNSEDKKEPLE
jgi:hypothetical protein